MKLGFSILGIGIVIYLFGLLNASYLFVNLGSLASFIGLGIAYSKRRR